MTLVEGKRVQVGDVVCFKSDVEQSGTIYRIDGNTLYLQNTYGFQGDYIGGQDTTQVLAGDCWIEG